MRAGDTDPVAPLPQDFPEGCLTLGRFCSYVPVEVGKGLAFSEMDFRTMKVEGKQPCWEAPQFSASLVIGSGELMKFVSPPAFRGRNPSSLGSRGFRILHIPF